jgi:hypothetical protein
VSAPAEGCARVRLRSVSILSSGAAFRCRNEGDRYTIVHDMTCVTTESLCQSISISIVNVHNAFRSRVQRSEILNSFWSLQDHLARLVDAASDRPAEVFGLLKENHPLLIQNIVGVLAAAAEGSLARNAAVSSCCETINELLMELETLEPTSRPATAGA